MKSKIEEFKRTADNQPLKEVMDRLFKVYNLESRLKEVDLINAWPELMGPAVAHRTKNIFLKGSVLHVQIDSSVAREELANGKQIIIDRMNAYAGTILITDVWFS
jgi:hypothetical protein